MNEMSMIAYYHYIKPSEFINLPVLPRHPDIIYPHNRHVCNLTSFAIDGHEIGADTNGVWDPNRYITVMLCLFVCLLVSVMVYHYYLIIL